jgi:hypothetical protein
MYFRTLQMKYLVYFLLLANIIYTSTAYAQQQIVLKTWVLSIENNQPIPLANATNNTTSTRFIGSRQGLLKVTVAPNDSITITAIGYETIKIKASPIIPENIEDTTTLYMRPTAYQLKDVTIYSRDKRRDSIAMRAAEILSNDPLMNNYERALNTDSGGLMSPLTAMWYEYSKEGKNLQRFREFVQHAEMLKQVNNRYNKKTIKRATGLDDEYLDAYILYCNIDRAFVLNSSDYELILAMQQCANRFKTEKGIE